MRPKDKIWSYFKKIDENLVLCNLCDKRIKTYGQPFNMMKHLNTHNKSARKEEMLEELRLSTERKKRSTDDYNHQLEFDNTENTQTPHAELSFEAHEEKPLFMSSPIVLEKISDNSGERISNNFDGDNYHAQISDAILYFICVDHQPFDIIQCKGFKHLMEESVPLYKIPSKDILKKRLDGKYDSVIQIFKQKLREAPHVTITTDIWSAPVASRSFLGITAHFIATDSRKLESGNIEVIELSKYTTDYIARIFLNTLTKWSIDINKVVAVVTNDNSDIVSAVIQTFGQNRHIPCFAHAVNIVAKNSITKCKDLDNIIHKVRSIVKFVTSNIAMCNELQQRQIDLGIAERNTKKLILNVNSMWSTIIHMIERFVELWNVIKDVLFGKNNVPEMIQNDELVALEEILKLLKPLEFMAQECSNNINVSKIIPLISCIQMEYRKTTQTMELSAKLKQAILIGLEERFGDIEFVNSISIATILDPRFKTIHFRNIEALSNIIYSLREMIDKLYKASSFESDVEQNEAKYDLWIYHKFLTHEPKKENGAPSRGIRDELSLYLASPFASLKDDPIEKWESMKILCPSLYKIAIKYLSVVPTSVSGERLFSKEGTALTQSRNQLDGKRLNKLLFLNSVNEEYWFQ